MTRPKLHMLCGKIASGKSTLAQRLVEQDDAMIIAEDDWLRILFGEEMKTAKDFARCSAKLRTAMKPHIIALLKAGTTVVLDFQANTVESRAWMLAIAEEAEVAHRLHFLDVPDAICLERLRARNAAGTHLFSPSEEQFHLFAKFFVPPSPNEGLMIERLTADL